MSWARAAVGIDFGGTRIKAGLVEQGRVVRAESVETPAGMPPAHVLDAIVEVISRLGVTPTSLGVAIPGEVDGDGRCYRLPNVPGFEGVNIGAELEARLSCEVVVENDASAAALGELLHGWGSRYSSFLLATLGTGVGGGLVLDGRMRAGAHGFCGEIGHLLIDTSAEAWVCPCGRPGHVESYAGTRGLQRRFVELGGPPSEPVEIAARAMNGDEAAREAFATMGRALGAGLAQVQNVLDLPALIFTGGISQSFGLIEPALRAALREHSFGAPAAEVPLLVSELGGHAGVLGAAALPSTAQTEVK